MTNGGRLLMETGNPEALTRSGQSLSNAGYWAFGHSVPLAAQIELKKIYIYKIMYK